MRVLIAANPALGHVLPILPLAIALRNAGHEVAFLTGSSMSGPLAGAGLRHVVGGPPDLPTAFAQVPERAGLTGRRLAMVTWQRGFGVVIARAIQRDRPVGARGLARRRSRTPCRSRDCRMRTRCSMRSRASFAGFFADTR